MYKLLKNEFVKFSNSYIYYLSFFAMLLPLVLSIIIWYLRRDSFTTSNMYHWDGLINSLQLFYSLFLGAIIPSFIAVFAVFYEFQEKTLHNLLTMPYSRTQILLAKIISSCSIIILINIAVWIIAVIFGLLLGFDNSVNVIFAKTMKLLLPNLATVLFVPIMIFLTLSFRSFLHGMVLTVVCSVMNFALLYKDSAFLFPWSIPSNIYFILDGRVTTDFIYPVTSALIVFALFLFLSIITFRKMDVSR